MRRAEISMLTAEELRLLRRKRRRIALALLLVLVLGLVAFFAARPIRNAIKGWQARRHAEKAFMLIQQEKWKEAKDAAVAAYQLRASEPAALRAVARFLSRTRQQQALEFWDQLAKQQALTREDRRDEAAVALVSGELGRAATAVDSLLAKDGTDATPRDWLLAAQVRMQQGAPEEALDAAGKILADSRATPREQFQATLLQLQAARTADAERNARAQGDAWERLNRIAEGNDAVALDSLVLLAQRQLTSSGGTISRSSDASSLENPGEASAVSPEITSPTDDKSPITDNELGRGELVRRLEAHPLAKAPQKLLAIDLQLQANPSEKEALVARAISEWKEAEPSQLAVLATWLNGKGEFQRTLDTIDLDRAVQTRELFLQHVDALGALGRWDEIKRLLESERFPLDPVIQRMYLARCNAQLGQQAASENNWQRALEAAGSDIGKLMTLAEYAEKNGALEIAANAYQSALITGPKLRPAQQGRLRLALAAKNTRKMHSILAEMLHFWPDDTAIQNDEAYMRLLLLPSDLATLNSQPQVPPKSDEGGSTSEHLIQIEQLAEKLVQQDPASLPHRTLLALARLRQQRPVAALEVYSGIQVSPNALTPSALAVHAAVLAANGRRDDARTEIQQAPIDKLLPEEGAGTADLRE